MEFLLLWADEIDDALGAARHLGRKIFGALAAIAMLAAAGFGLLAL